MLVYQWIRSAADTFKIPGIFIFLLACCQCSPANSDHKKLTSTKLRELTHQIDTTTIPLAAEKINQAKQLAAKPDSAALRIRLYTVLGNYYWDFGEPEKAYLHFDTLQRIAAAEKSNALEIEAGLQKVQIFAESGRNSEAEKMLADLLKKCRERNDSLLAAKCMDQQAIQLFKQGKYTQAKQLLLQAATYLRNDTTSHVFIGLYNTLGAVSFKLADFDDGTGYFERSIRSSISLPDSIAIATTCINIGMAYNEQAFYDLATEYLLKALPILEKKELFYELGTCYSVLGNTHFQVSGTADALKYHTLALDVRQKLNDTANIALSLTNIGEVNLQEGNLELALQSLEKSLLLLKQTDTTKTGPSLNLIGQVWFERNDDTKAELYFSNALGRMQQAADRKGEAEVRNNLAKLYVRQHKYDAAFIQLKKAEQISRQSAARKVLLTAYKIRHSLHRARNEWKQTVALNDTITLLEDSLFNEQKDKTIRGLNIRYKTAENERKITELKKTGQLNAVQIEKNKFTIGFLISGISLLLVIVVFAIYAYRSKQQSLRQSNQLILQKQQLIDQKQYMLSELHHRIKNNLQVLATLLSLQQKRLNDSGSREALRAVENRLDAMLLIHKGLYGDATDGTVELNSYLEKLIDNLVASYDFEHLHTTLRIETIRLDADIALNIGFIANEIISNALKHAFGQTENPEIKVQSWQESGKFRFIFTDNGCGMPKAGTAVRDESFGLKLIRILIQQMHGTLETRTGDTGTTFEIEIPSKPYTT